MGRKPKFVITDYRFPTIEAERSIIERAGGELDVFQCKSEEDVIAASREADALLVQFAPITQAVIESLRICKVIVRYGIGMDNIDIDSAIHHGIAVRNVPDYCVEEVADHTFALAMSLSRQLPAIDRQLRQGVWKIVPPRPMIASRSANFVTIGCGKIAQAVLKRAAAFKFRLGTCDPYLSVDAELPDGIRKMDMEEALRTADILSLHLPLSKETMHLIDATSLSKMKPTALLVNTSRGGLVDTVALACSLETGRIAGAGVDVFEREPLEENHPLRTCPNTVLTSHVAWYSEMSGQELQRTAVEEAVRVVFGETVHGSSQRDGTQPPAR
jgi:D-3-phosphoglycerate dehydrogenase